MNSLSMPLLPSRRAARWLALSLALVAAGCGGRVTPEPPPEPAVRELFLSVLGPGRDVDPSRLAALEQTPEGAVYREPTAEELEALWLPPPIERIEFVDFRVQYYPVWRVGFREPREGDPGPVLLAEVVEVDGSLRMLLRWRPAIENDADELAPDFRVKSPGRKALDDAEQAVTVVVQPRWTDLRMEPVR